MKRRNSNPAANLRARARHISSLAVIAAAGTLALPSAEAVTLTADYSSLGTVYQDAAGNLYSSSGAGRSDVTATFKLDISTAMTYLQNVITLPWNESITFKLADLSASGAVANSGIDTFNGDGANNTVNRPSGSTVQYTTAAGNPMFLDPTPVDNSEFNMTTGTASLGGGTVNNKNFGLATAAGGASGRWDFLTLTIHELEHSLGISSGSQRFLSLAGASTDTNRKLTISSALSGLPNNFDIPIVTRSAHYSGSATGTDTFGYAVVAQPGWQIGQRALPTCLDILGIGQVEGATANQINCDISLVPEPGSLGILGLGLALFMSNHRWNRKG